MPTLNALSSTADVLRAFDRVLEVTQNNLANVATLDGTATPENVFAALNSLRLALVNDDSAARYTAMLAQRSASHHLNNVQSFVAAPPSR